jgi:hypothetical protein
MGPINTFHFIGLAYQMMRLLNLFLPYISCLLAAVNVSWEAAQIIYPMQTTVGLTSRECR